jgi:hypothetical protein
MTWVLLLEVLDLAFEVLLLLLGRDAGVDVVLSLVFVGLLLRRLELISTMSTFSSYILELSLGSPPSDCFCRDTAVLC